MKIIARDNYDRDYVPDKVIAFDLKESEARTRCRELNAAGEISRSEWFYMVVADDFKIKSRNPI